jgi:hypothetical protein
MSLDLVHLVVLRVATFSDLMRLRQVSGRCRQLVDTSFLSWAIGQPDGTETLPFSFAELKFVRQHVDGERPFRGGCFLAGDQLTTVWSQFLYTAALCCVATQASFLSRGVSSGRAAERGLCADRSGTVRARLTALRYGLGGAASWCCEG